MGKEKEHSLTSFSNPSLTLASHHEVGWRDAYSEIQGWEVDKKTGMAICLARWEKNTE